MISSLSRFLTPGLLFRGLEWALLLLIAVQAARLLWVVVTPSGPLGEARAITSAAPPGGSFDPFFRLSTQPDSTVVTSLALKLFGVRMDEAMGGGSAIIESASGIQSSIGVGEEIMAGVRLTKVDFDSVTIERNGVSEQLFLDQSVAVPSAVPANQITPPVSPPIQIVPSVSRDIAPENTGVGNQSTSPPNQQAAPKP